MNEDQRRSRAEAEPLLGVAEKLLQNRDLNGAKDFAMLAQENEPTLEGPDQILAVAEVLLASDKRVTSHQNNSLQDWYSILQVPRRSDDLDLIKKQYRRLALLLHPDKNKYPLADQAFKLVADAWAVLSDPSKKAHFDNESGPFFSRVDLTNSSAKLPVRKTQPVRNAPPSSSDSGRKGPTPFWTVCPYCYVLYEYPKAYENCCLKCQSCDRAFHGAVINTMPPLVPGKDAYYCTWGFFPMGFVFAGVDGKATPPPSHPPPPPSPGNGSVPGFVNWMPNLFGPGKQVQQPQPRVEQQQVRVSGQGRGGGGSGTGTGKKRGRPRKYPVQT